MQNKKILLNDMIKNTIFLLSYTQITVEGGLHEHNPGGGARKVPILVGFQGKRSKKPQHILIWDRNGQYDVKNDMKKRSQQKKTNSFLAPKMRQKKKVQKRCLNKFFFNLQKTHTGLERKKYLRNKKNTTHTHYYTKKCLCAQRPPQNAHIRYTHTHTCIPKKGGYTFFAFKHTWDGGKNFWRALNSIVTNTGG